MPRPLNIPPDVKGTPIEAVHRALDSLDEDTFTVVAIVVPREGQTFCMISGEDEMVTKATGVLCELVEAKTRQPRHRDS